MFVSATAENWDGIESINDAMQDRNEIANGCNINFLKDPATSLSEDCCWGDVANEVKSYLTKGGFSSVTNGRKVPEYVGNALTWCLKAYSNSDLNGGLPLDCLYKDTYKVKISELPIKGDHFLPDPMANFMVDKWDQSVLKGHSLEDEAKLKVDTTTTTTSTTSTTTSTT